MNLTVDHETTLIHNGKIIKHQYDSLGFHRLQVNDLESKWYIISNIGMFEGYHFTTNYWTGVFPEIFQVSILLDTPQS